MRTTCCICSDILDEVIPTSATPCGHVFHSECLNMWIKHSDTCPICRKNVNHRNILKLYFTQPTSGFVENSSVLENEVSNLKVRLSAKDMELKMLRKKIEDSSEFIRQAEMKSLGLQQRVYEKESEINKLRLRLKSMSKLEGRNLKLEQMNAALTNDLNHLNNIQLIVNGTQKDVDNIVQESGDASAATKQMATYCTILKRELQNVLNSKNKLLEEKSKLQQENCRYAAKVKFYEEAIAVNNKSGQLPTDPCTSAIKKTYIKQDNKNYSPITSKLLKSSDQTEVDVSPLSVPFKKSNFNLHIVASSSTSYKTGESSSETKAMHTAAALNTDYNDSNSVIRTGYNGLGGHSNFINTSSGIKKFKTLKRKI